MSMSSNAHASLKDRLRDQAYCIQSQTLRNCILLTFKALLPSSDHERYLEMGILLSFENGRESLKLKTRQVYPHGGPNNLKEYMGLPFSTFLSQNFSILLNFFYFLNFFFNFKTRQVYHHGMPNNLEKYLRLWSSHT